MPLKSMQVVTVIDIDIVFVVVIVVVIVFGIGCNANDPFASGCGWGIDIKIISHSIQPVIVKHGCLVVFLRPTDIGCVFSLHNFLVVLQGI